MILRTIQSIRTRIAATDERSDQVKPGELEVPCGGRTRGPGHDETSVNVVRRGGVLGSQLQPRQTGLTLGESNPSANHNGESVTAGKDPHKVYGQTVQDGTAMEATVSGDERLTVVRDGDLPKKTARISLISVAMPDAANVTSEPRKITAGSPVCSVGAIPIPDQSKCPICDGPTSRLTGGACPTCRRKMDAAMDAQMKQLADDREFQRELEEALEQLDAMPPQKLRYCECCKEPFHDDYRSVCPRHHCQLWLEGEKYRRWNAELEQSIKESIHG